MKDLEKIDTYLINVTVLEGRHYAWPDMDSYVEVRIGTMYNRTGVRRSTDSPYYNEFFVFELKTDLQSFLDQHISLTVVRPKKCCQRRKNLGYCTLDVATIWDQPEHIFYQKWAILSSQTPKFSGPRGYLKVTLAIVSKDVQVKLPLANPNVNDEIEGNLLLPDGITLERQRALFVFKVYKGQGISRRKSRVLENLKRAQKGGAPSSVVEITFAGITAATAIQKNNQNPIWNEKITIAELFPPLCQRVKIELRTTNTNLKVVKYLSLHSIANDQERGFLPTFGPAYVHFYTKDFFGDIYVGKVLIALHTQLQHEYLTKPKAFSKKSIVPLNEATLWRTEPVLLFCAILNVHAIDKRFSRKPIRFEISAGPTRLEHMGSGDNFAPNISNEMNPVTRDKVFWFLNFQGRMPCVHYQSNLPDLRWRFYNRNLIKKISSELKRRLDDIEPLFQYERCRIPSALIESKLVEALDELAVQCRKYIDIVRTNIDRQATQLDREKIKLCLREMEDIENLAKTIFNQKAKKKSYRRAQKLYSRMSLLEDHPQDCWPDILIYIIQDGKKISTHRIESDDVVYSMVDEEMGVNCGKIQNISFDTPLRLRSVRKTSIACKMDLILWIGLRRHMEFCFHSLPECFKFPRCINDATIPKYLVLDDKYCRAHIYQGKFHFGGDKTGLSDLYVRIILNEASACTAVIKAKLNPMWDETIIIHNIRIYGSRPYIKSNPPICIMEVLDYDDIFHSDYVGRVTVIPAVKLRDDPYTKPDFPPPLKWHTVMNKTFAIGKILACIELLERTSNDLPEYKKKKRGVTKLPDDVRPVLSGFKADILFWGVRQLKKLHGISVNRPKITVDFTVSLTESEPTTLKILNFEQKQKNLLINLPVESDYASSISFQLIDHRSFGRHVYVANHITHIERFMHYPITSEEREFLLTHQQTKSFDSMDSKILEQRDSTKLIGISRDKQTIRESMRGKYEETKEKLMETKEKLTKENFNETKEKLITNIKQKNRKGCCPCCRWCKRKKKEKNTHSSQHSAVVEMDPEMSNDSFTDWWTKYFISLEKFTDVLKTPTEADIAMIHNTRFRLKIYEEELENQTELNGLQDTIMTFPLIRGEISEDEDMEKKYFMGTFKGNIKIYPWPTRKGIDYVTSNGKSLKEGFFQDAPNNDALRFLARIYCVRGFNLRPRDLTSSTDPYLAAFMGDQHFSEPNDYIPRQLNPIFGKLFEFNGTFPSDSIVTVQVWDFDRYSCHDLIGETSIDLENRFYTKHRACCGLPYEYTEIGSCPWRDIELPSKILENLCKRNNIPLPQYFETYVMLGPLMFSANTCEDEIPKASYTKEELALDLLHKWHEVPVVGCHLVPEYVETRSLYNPQQPGLEQGKIQLWVDIFPISDLPPPPHVDITPRKPENFELRIIIWNTEDILLKEDDFFIGEKKSDIYVKAWLIGLEESQSTDVHYRSLNGEGNFNWRFVFNFAYLKTENKIVINKKEMFQLVESEKKVPCELKLQVWDNDTFSPDDFIGSISMDLACMPRGAKSPQLCSLKVTDPSAPRINLFKVKRTKGWWPFRGHDHKTHREVLAGKLEAEFHILTTDEADANPVGKGRKDPNPLPKPKKLNKKVQLKDAYVSALSSAMSYISSIRSQIAQSMIHFRYNTQKHL